MAEIVAGRKLKPSEVRKIRKKRKKQAEVDAGGRVDVEPVVSPDVVESLEREQMREQLSKIQVDIEGQPAGEAFKAAQAARRQAEQAEDVLTQQSIEFAENVADAEEQIKLLERNPESYTIDGKPVTRKEIDEMKQNLQEYKQDFGEYSESVVAQSGELRQYSSGLLGQVSDWSRKIVQRNLSVDEKKRGYNQALSQGMGFGSKYETESKGFNNRLVPPTPPGPGAGPAPGSFGEKLAQEFVSPTLRRAEAPFTAITQPIRAKAQILGEEAATRPASYEGLAKWSASIGLNILAGGIDVATLPVRPKLAARQIQTIGQLTFDPEARGALGETIAKDPVRFIAEVAGSAKLGSVLSGAAIRTVREAGPVSRAVRAGATPRQALAVARRSGVDVSGMSALERQLYSFPEEVVQPEFLQTFGPEKTFEAPETFRFQPLERGIWSSRELFKPRQAGLVVPEGVAVPSTIWRLRTTPLNIPSGAPGVRFVDFASSVARTRVPFINALTAFGVTAGKPSSLKRQRIPSVQKPGTLVQNLQRFNQQLTGKARQMNAPPGLVPGIIQPVKQPSIQTQPTRQRTRQIETLNIMQIPIPGIPEPVPQETTSLFQLPPPSRPTRYNEIFRLPEEKKKKPRKGRKKITKTEKRFDPLKKLRLRL